MPGNRLDAPRSPDATACASACWKLLRSSSFTDRERQPEARNAASVRTDGGALEVGAFMGVPCGARSPDSDARTA